jgi:hypothetical protein
MSPSMPGLDDNLDVEIEVISAAEWIYTINPGVFGDVHEIITFYFFDYLPGVQPDEILLGWPISL